MGLLVDGNVTITHPGTYDGLVVRGRVRVAAPAVTLRNCQVMGRQSRWHRLLRHFRR